MITTAKTEGLALGLTVVTGLVCSLCLFDDFTSVKVAEPVYGLALSPYLFLEAFPYYFTANEISVLSSAILLYIYRIVL